MDLSIYDLAIVSVRNFTSKASFRKARGAAGSGRGVRSLVEFLNCNFTYAFDSLQNQVDVEFKIEPSNFETFRDERPYSKDSAHTTEVIHLDTAHKQFLSLDFDSTYLKCAAIPSPTAMPSYSSQDLVLRSDTCDAVFSCEDLLFCHKVVSAFLLDNTSEVSADVSSR